MEPGTRALGRSMDMARERYHQEGVVRDENRSQRICPRMLDVEPRCVFLLRIKPNRE